jgi:hypothetical protein
MNEITIQELKDLILYQLEKPTRRKYNKKVKQERQKITKFIEPNYNRKYEEDLNDLDDFKLNFGLDYIEPKKKLQHKIKIIEPKEEEEESNDWFDIGSGHKNIQSVLVPKRYFTEKQAIRYIKQHFQFKKIDETKKYYRFRQHEPKKDVHYISKKLSNGVILVIEYDGDMGGSLPVDIIYKSIKNGYSHPEIENIGDGYILSPNDSSKEVQVYINFKEKRIIINFIGTYNTIDWINNYEYIKGRYRNTRRFKHAKETLEKIIKLYPNFQISLIGHSQSAVITRELGKDYGDKIFEIINLNGANLREKSLQNEYNIRSNIDIVSLLTRNNDRVITIPREGFNLLKEHSPDILKRLNPSHLIGV